MKIRNGFVSNSSSSSFMILATKEYFDEAIQDLSDRDQEIVQQSLRPTHQFGKDLFFIDAYCATEEAYVRGLYGLRNDDLDYDDENWEEEVEKILNSYNKIYGVLRPQGASEGNPGNDERAFWQETYQ